MKSNKILIIVIVVLSLAVLGLGGFVIYDKIIKEDNKTEIPSSNDLEIDSSNIEKNEDNKNSDSKDDISEATNNIKEIINIINDNCLDIKYSKYFADDNGTIHSGNYTFNSNVKINLFDDSIKSYIAKYSLNYTLPTYGYCQDEDNYIYEIIKADEFNDYKEKYISKYVSLWNEKPNFNNPFGPSFSTIDIKDEDYLNYDCKNIEKNEMLSGKYKFNSGYDPGLNYDSCFGGLYMDNPFNIKFNNIENENTSYIAYVDLIDKDNILGNHKGKITFKYDDKVFILENYEMIS